MPRRKKQNSSKLVGYMMYAVAVGMPFTNMPQLLQIYTTKITTGLSVATWMMYLVFGFIPLLYAISNKLRPLVISNILWMIIYVFMIVGIMRYSPHLVPSSYDKLLHINNMGKAINQLGLFCLSLACALFSLDLLEVKKGYVRN